MSISRKLTTAALAAALATGAGSLARAQDASLDLVGPLAEYKIYVAAHTAELVKDTREFVAAIKAGDVDKAKSLFAPTRTSYEAVEPIALLVFDAGTFRSLAEDPELRPLLLPERAAA